MVIFLDSHQYCLNLDQNRTHVTTSLPNTALISRAPAYPACYDELTIFTVTGPFPSIF